MSELNQLLLDFDHNIEFNEVMPYIWVTVMLTKTYSKKLS